VRGRRSVADSPELDEAVVGTGFAARPVVTDRERRDAVAALHQDCVTEVLRMRCLDLLSEVKPGIERASCVAARTQRLFPPCFAKLAETRPAGRFLARLAPT